MTTVRTTSDAPAVAAAPTAPPQPLQASQAERTVNDMLQAAWLARAIHVAVELGVPDHVADGPVGSRMLADRTGTHPRSLRKLLRLLATVGVLRQQPGEDGDLLIGPTELSDVLRTDPTGVVATDARFQAATWHWAAWGNLKHSIRTGEDAFTRANGTTFWNFIQTDEDAAARFENAMASVSLRESQEIPRRYDFTRCRHVVDVGGGTGSLLAAILESSPATRGTLLDRADVAAAARRRFVERGLADRATAVGGDFHDTVPAGADTYVVKHVLHDWDDDDVVAILQRVRQAMGTGSRLLIIDTQIDPQASADTLFVDLLMLVLVGGGDRDEAELTRLAARAGLAVRDSGPAGTGALRYLECVPV